MPEVGWAPRALRGLGGSLKQGPLPLQVHHSHTRALLGKGQPLVWSRRYRGVWHGGLRALESRTEGGPDAPSPAEPLPLRELAGSQTRWKYNGIIDGPLLLGFIQPFRRGTSVVSPRKQKPRQEMNQGCAGGPGAQAAALTCICLSRGCSPQSPPATACEVQEMPLMGFYCALSNARSSMAAAGLRVTHLHCQNPLKAEVGVRKLLGVLGRGLS